MKIPPDAYRLAARRMFHMEGEMEIDDNASVSLGADGAWVQAWVWVSDTEVHPKERRKAG